MRFAICNEIFRGWTLKDTFAYAAKSGYDAVEIAPFTIADSVNNITTQQRQEIRKAARESHIEIAGIHWVLVKPEGLYLNHSDPTIRERTADYLRALVEFCADLGGQVMVVGSPKQRNVLPGVDSEQACQWALETFRTAVAQAEHRNITICFEPLSPTETNFVNTAVDAIGFVRRMNSTRFKIILDVKAMCSESKSIPELIRDSYPDFAHFHANDRNLKGPGFGDVDFKPIAQTLKQVGYSGYVSVEVFDFTEGPQVISDQSIKYLKRCFG